MSSKPQQQEVQSDYSMGTTPMMKSIEELISDKDEMIDVACINLGTLVRNCMSNSAVTDAVEFDRRHGAKTQHPANVLFEEAKKEMVRVIQDTCQMFNNNRFAVNPVVITYHSDYSKSVPKEVYKAPADGKYYLTAADQLVRSTLIRGSRKSARQGNVMVIELPINDRFLPWRHIMNELKDIKNNHNVVMVSNHPVDYHVGSVSHTFRIVRSYTGEVVEYKQLGKTVFKNNVLPFNLFTHALLGDKEDVKCTISSGDKANLLQIAEKEEWMLKTKDYIHDRLYQLGIKIPTHF